MERVWPTASGGRGTALGLLIVASLTISQLAAARCFTDRVTASSRIPPPVPKSTIAKIADLTAGYGGFLGAASWVETIFTYAGVLFEMDPTGPVVSGFALTSGLDTLWGHPRLIAAWAIPQLKGYSSRDALPFLEDGARRFPQEWKFRLTWAEYVLDAHDIDSTAARDSAAKILLPLSTMDAKVPQYARDLAFTLLHESGRPEEAMSLLLKTYEQVNDPLVRLQFRGKIGDLLLRNRVPLGSDSADFMDGIAALLESKDGGDRAVADHLLTDLVDTAHRDAALVSARQLAGQYKSYRSASP